MSCGGVRSKKMLEACGLDVRKVSITEDNIITVE